MKDRNFCPECEKYFSRKAKHCDCGWRPQHQSTTVISDFRCEYTSYGSRCPLPGSICSHPYSNGPWYCSGHWRTQSDHKLAAEILKDAEKNYHQILEDRKDWCKKLIP